MLLVLIRIHSRVERFWLQNWCVYACFKIEGMRSRLWLYKYSSNLWVALCSVIYIQIVWIFLLLCLILYVEVRSPIHSQQFEYSCCYISGCSDLEIFLDLLINYYGVFNHFVHCMFTFFSDYIVHVLFYFPNITALTGYLYFSEENG